MSPTIVRFFPFLMVFGLALSIPIGMTALSSLLGPEKKLQ